MSPKEIEHLENYLRRVFEQDKISVHARKVGDSAEVYKDQEFIGVLYRDDEDPTDISYNFDMAILQADLSEF